MSNWRALLVHGAGGGAWEWNRWRGVLRAHGIGVDAIDLAHAHADPAATRLEDYLAQVRDALDMLRALSPSGSRRLLVGASLGGLLAAECAEASDALVLVNPMPPAPWHAPSTRWTERSVVRWGTEARLESTRAAIENADEASALFAFRRWRDESAQVLHQASAGREVARPECPALFMVSSSDTDIDADRMRAWARAWGSDCVETIAPGHVGPLLGAQAARDAAQAVAWLNRLENRG